MIPPLTIDLTSTLPALAEQVAALLRRERPDCRIDADGCGVIVQSPDPTEPTVTLRLRAIPALWVKRQWRDQ